MKRNGGGYRKSLLIAAAIIILLLMGTVVYAVTHSSSSSIDAIEEPAAAETVIAEPVVASSIAEGKEEEIQAEEIPAQNGQEIQRPEDKATINDEPDASVAPIIVPYSVMDIKGTFTSYAAETAITSNASSEAIRGFADYEEAKYSIDADYSVDGSTLTISHPELTEAERHGYIAILLSDLEEYLSSASAEEEEIPSPEAVIEEPQIAEVEETAEPEAAVETPVIIEEQAAKTEAPAITEEQTAEEAAEPAVIEEESSEELIIDENNAAGTGNTYNITVINSPVPAALSEPAEEVAIEEEEEKDTLHTVYLSWSPYSYEYVDFYNLRDAVDSIGRDQFGSSYGFSFNLGYEFNVLPFLSVGARTGFAGYFPNRSILPSEKFYYQIPVLAEVAFRAHVEDVSFRLGVNAGIDAANLLDGSGVYFMTGFNFGVDFRITDAWTVFWRAEHTFTLQPHGEDILSSVTYTAHPGTIGLSYNF